MKEGAAMKVRITFVTENQHPASKLLRKREEKKLREMWDILMPLIATGSGNDKATIESVEIVDEGGAYKLVSEEIDSWKFAPPEKEGGEE